MTGLTTDSACKCPAFREEDAERLDAEYEAQKYDDMREQYR